jgi:hypothetical protein
MVEHPEEYFDRLVARDRVADVLGVARNPLYA